MLMRNVFNKPDWLNADSIESGEGDNQSDVVYRRTVVHGRSALMVAVLANGASPWQGYRITAKSFNFAMSW